MEDPDSESTPPPAPIPSSSQTTPPPGAAVADDEAAAADGDPAPPSRKRRRRKKQFPGMVPTAGLRVLRPHTARSAAPVAQSEKALDEQLAAPSSAPRRRGRPPSSSSLRLARELDVEALIAAAVGFPVDSLAEEEIEASVVPALGGAAQSNYIVVRNHIVARWRSNPSAWVTESQALESIRAEHRALVAAAYAFLLDHAYINFGLAPAVLSAPPRRAPSLPPPSVLVVGAGLAGLAAARHLLSLGFKVAVLEGRRRPGGRVFTKRMASSAAEYPDVAAAADLGGSVLTGINGNPLGVLARQLGFPLHKVRDKCPLYLPDGRPVDPVVDSRIEAAFNELLDKVCRLRQAVADELRSVDASLGDALEAFRAAYGVAASREERMLLDWHLANLEYANAALLSDLSMAFWDQDDPYEMGGDHCFIPGGNARFVRALAQDVPVFYGRTVTRVRYAGDGVLLQAGRQLFRADMALCTVPLGVLKKGRIHFSPPLPPRKQAAIQRLGFGLLNKVAILFPYDFWDGSVDTFGHLTDDPSQRGEFFLFYSYASVSGGPLLVALVAGESAIRFETTPPMDNVDKVLRVLRRIFSPKGIEIPKPLQAICTRWGTDRFAYGSYSYVAVGSSGDDYDILAESAGDGRLFFAGEATNRRYPATMHGALLSGFREAANIARAARRRATGPSVAEGTCVKDDVMDLDDLFRTPDLSFGAFTVLHDPSSPGPDSTSLLRVGIGERKLGSGSLFLYGLISRKHAEELAGADGDDRRLSMLYRNYGTKLAGRNGLGSPGESLIARIKATRSDSSKSRTANGTHNS
ncbi:Lysine-specific histone demethylase 1 [Ananas comosus]|uniref:Lysine-specific histone demethylase 1 n=1 Tax=Ananas comosus TaxID=4615 RepID=A0A199V010_ANACO|nr:Lysine-specific histone demethylase 1 [Ananas comosus]